MSDFITPGSVVRVKSAGWSEEGIVGFVRRTKPDNGDTYLVTVLSTPHVNHFVKAGTNLSYNERDLEVVPK